MRNWFTPCRTAAGQGPAPQLDVALSALRKLSDMGLAGPAAATLLNDGKLSVSLVQQLKPDVL